MRVGSFKVAGADGKQADVSIVPLPGMAGTDSANVNRWRGQVGLSVVTDDELQKAAENVEAGGQPAQLYDIAGTNPAGGGAQRILGVIQHRDGMAWFYKMTGDADLVEQQKPAFVEFLKSLKFGAAAPAQVEMPAAIPAGIRPAAIWARCCPLPRRLRVRRQAELAGAGGLAGSRRRTISRGEIHAHRRWRRDGGGQRQFVCPVTAAVWRPTSTAGAASLACRRALIVWRRRLTSPAARRSLVDFSGTDARTGQPARLVGVVVSQPDQTWFYKLMGDAKVVESQKDAFTQFVQSAKY